jgi:hypothetical protein
VLKYRQTYRFNDVIPDSLFLLKCDKPTVKMVEAQRELSDAWAKPLATAGHAEVRDASVSADGTIWIAVSTNGKEGQAVLPTTITTPAGAAYTRTLDIVPSSILGKSHRFSLGEESVYVVGFVPLRTGDELPAEATVALVQRDVHPPGQSIQAEGPRQPVGAPLKLDLHTEPGERPAYFVTLDLDHFGFQLGYLVFEARAKALEADGKPADAARAYEQDAIACRAFFPRLGERPLRAAARCYASAGMAAAAKRATELADHVRRE